MKKLYTMVLAAALVGTFTSCDDFLDYKPTAVVDEDKAFSEPDKMVNSAYAMLGDCWYSLQIHQKSPVRSEKMISQFLL